MDLTIKDLGIKLEPKNTGTHFHVHKNVDGKDKLVGSLYVAKAGMTWRDGRTTRPNGVTVTWDDFIEWMQSDEEE